MQCRGMGDNRAALPSRIILSLRLRPFEDVEEFHISFIYFVFDVAKLGMNFSIRRKIIMLQHLTHPLAFNRLQPCKPPCPLKSWVYNAPVRKIYRPDGSEEMTEVSVDDILFVLSLPLIDRYLETHPDKIK